MAHDDFGLATRSAAILGPSSAAKKALDEHKRRSLRGEDVGIWLLKNRWIVGPVPQSAKSDGRS